jgi:DNA-binding NarL/FixJ family response regulator
MLSEPAISVLLVDDDPLVLAATSRFLVKRGLYTICASSPFGVTALVWKESPDVVVMDCHMPGLDGAQLIRCLRVNRRTATTPVVFYSGDSDEALQNLASSLGARYAAKSRGPSSLLQVIRDALPRARRGWAHAG